ncbi:MAG TPA: hypothetical protein VG028_11610 [Terriglobia bacterium]|nr:hypothetical protein [Terriglobia bacterium]
MKKMKGLLLVVSLLALVPLLAQTQNLFTHKDSLTVYDSKEKAVGTVIDTSFSWAGNYAQGGVPTIALRTGQLNVFLGVFPDHFMGNAPYLLFSTVDCSGTPYFHYPPEGSRAPSLISQSFVKNDGTVYAAPGNTSASTIVFIGSAFGTDHFPGPTVCSPDSSGNEEVVQAQELGNIYDMFQPPFVLK